MISLKIYAKVLGIICREKLVRVKNDNEAHKNQ
jgi:hypothetical protein